MEYLRILIVEDEMLIARNLQVFLEKKGYEVVGIACSFEEAVEQLDEQGPDLALLDIRLAGRKSGIDLATYINEQHQIPFIFLTSYADAATMDQAKSVQPAAFLNKPYRESELYAAIELAVRNYAAGAIQEEIDLGENVLVQNAIWFRNQQVYRKVLLEDILWLKGEGSYTAVQTREGKIMVRGYLKQFLELGEFEGLIRVHKSYVVNIREVEEIRPRSVLIGKEEIPINKAIRGELLERLHTF